MLVKPVKPTTFNRGHTNPKLRHALGSDQLIRRPRQQRTASCCHSTSGDVPRVTLIFETANGTATVDCESGDILRDVMLEAKIDLYTTWGKIVSCGGSGQCGTCVVQALDGQELLSEKNDTERKKLRKKPESYRLACQTNVGDGTNTGTISFKNKPP